MLIITADDYGKTKEATDNIRYCYLHKRITAASTMLFMEDSARAAALALDTKIDFGLHLNFTSSFTSPSAPLWLREHQGRVISYLSKHKLAQVIYNPFLSNSFDILFLAQRDEFVRLFGRYPDFYNGHHHMHLCTNVLTANIIPKGSRVRRTFTFETGEKNPFNRFYRHILDTIVSKRFLSTDSFFSIVPVADIYRLQKIVQRARRETVEIEVHPEIWHEMEFLLSANYANLLDPFQVGGFRDCF